jgi:hypothetical protein
MDEAYQSEVTDVLTSRACFTGESKFTFHAQTQANQLVGANDAQRIGQRFYEPTRIARMHKRDKLRREGAGQTPIDDTGISIMQR